MKLSLLLRRLDTVDKIVGRQRRLYCFVFTLGYSRSHAKRAMGTSYVVP